MTKEELLEKQFMQLNEISDVLAKKIKVLASEPLSADGVLTLVAAAERLEDLMREIDERKVGI